MERKANNIDDDTGQWIARMVGRAAFRPVDMTDLRHLLTEAYLRGHVQGVSTAIKELAGNTKETQ